MINFSHSKNGYQRLLKIKQNLELQSEQLKTANDYNDWYIIIRSVSLKTGKLFVKLVNKCDGWLASIQKQHQLIIIFQNNLVS